MTTQTTHGNLQTHDHHQSVDEKIERMRELFEDAPEVGKTALDRGVDAN